jgi:hypothetical protein
MFVWVQFAELQDPPTAQGGKEGREKVVKSLSRGE